VTNTGRVEMKMKSITQNGFTEDILAWNEGNTDLMRTGVGLTKASLENLLKQQDQVLQVIYPTHLKKNKKDQIIRNVIMPKSLRLVYDKRILKDDFTTLPFGTKQVQ